ncbi:hypothetical protein M8C21_008644, partial [Ambrosia artemisiifolia]
ETTETENASEFTLSEVFEMELLYRKRGKEVKQPEFCEELAAKFSGSANRNGKSIIRRDQVHTWFLDRELFSAVKSKSSVVDSNVVKNKLAIINSSPTALKNFVALSKAHAAAEIPKKPKAQRVEEIADLAFEALSVKDCAWYDVASFLNFRVMYTGELEVRVRFSGFSNDQDEWVNVRSAIRERSIPLEASECHKVKDGDLLLCYRANEDHALYSDAHLVRVVRQLHDKDNCTCTFLVRFEYDNSEMELTCAEICRRPS